MAPRHRVDTTLPPPNNWHLTEDVGDRCFSVNHFEKPDGSGCQCGRWLFVVVDDHREAVLAPGQPVDQPFRP